MKLRLTITAALIALAPAVSATTIYNTGTLIFETQERQSIWGEGNAIRYEGEERLGIDLEGSSSVGGFADITTNVPNPALAEHALCLLNPFSDCGDPPPLTIPITVGKSGAELTATSSGFLGAEVGYVLDGGSVGASLVYNAQAFIPDAGDVDVGERFQINPNSEWVDGTLDAQSPTAQASFGTLVDIDFGITGEACLLAGCQTFGGSILNTGEQRQEVVGIDANSVKFLDGFIPGVTIEQPLLDQDASLSVGAALSGPTVTVEITSTDDDGNTSTTRIDTSPSVEVTVDVAEVGIQFPEANGSARLQGDAITLELESEFLQASADIDTLVPIIPVGGLNVGFGPLSVTLEAYDADVGPQLDVFQDLRLESSLFVDLEFDELVEVEGTLVDSWSGLWDELPEFAVFEATTFTPLFSVVSNLMNDTGVTLGFELTASLLRAAVSVDIGIINLLDQSIGPLISRTIPFGQDLATLSLFDQSFALNGFNTVQGASFVIDPNDPAAVVPLPAGVVLLMSGLGGLMVMRRRRSVPG